MKLPDTKPPEIDPLAPLEEILKMPVLQALAHPNCPIELWWKLAESLPMEARRSALFPLILLESPDRWAALVSANARRWINKYARRLPTLLQHELAADASERCLPFFEAVYPGDRRVREAIRVRRLFALDLASVEEWDSARAAAGISYLFAHHRVKQGPNYESAMLAARSVTWPVPDCLESACASFLFQGETTQEKREQRIKIESSWQWERLCDLYDNRVRQG